MDMKCLSFVIIAIICFNKVSTADDTTPLYRDVLEQLEERLLENMDAQETKSLLSQTDSQTETDIYQSLFRNLQNKDDKAKKRLKYTDGGLKAFPVCKPYMPFPRPISCCDCRATKVNLLNGAASGVTGVVPGIAVLQKPTPQNDVTEECSKTALLKVNFQKFTRRPCNYCLRKPLCGRRMLRIDLKLSKSSRSEFGFNIGDSRTNDGYNGDRNTQINDAETQGRFPGVQVYRSDKCLSKLPLRHFSSAIGPNVNHVTIYVSNEHIRIVNDQGFDTYVCDKCLYALNGQSDIQGINEDIYIGLNRVVSGRSDRNGVGVCSATLTWSCPGW